MSWVAALSRAESRYSGHPWWPKAAANWVPADLVGGWERAGVHDHGELGVGAGKGA